MIARPRVGKEASPRPKVPFQSQNVPVGGHVDYHHSSDIGYR